MTDQPALSKHENDLLTGIIEPIAHLGIQLENAGILPKGAWREAVMSTLEVQQSFGASPARTLATRLLLVYLDEQAKAGKPPTFTVIHGGNSP